MHKITSYPVITTSHFAETVAFYEDVFCFVPVSEAEGYVRMYHPDTGALLTIIHSDSQILPPDMRRAGAHQILSLTTENLDEAYNELYLEGLHILKEPTEIVTGAKHFMVADPHNDVVINMITPVGFGKEQGCTGQC